jgi:hypothetical protein
MRILLLLLVTSLSVAAQEVQWQSLDGPYGGHTLLVGMPEGVLFQAPGGAVLRSDDGGGSWVDTGLAAGPVTSLTRGHDGTLLAVAASGAFRLADGEWQAIGPEGEAVRKALADAEGVVYLWLTGSDPCRIISSDDLETWNEAAARGADQFCLDVAVAHSGELVVSRTLVISGSVYHSLDHSDDGGETWSTHPTSASVARLVNGQFGGTFGLPNPQHTGFGGFAYAFEDGQWSPLDDAGITTVTTDPAGDYLVGRLTGINHPEIGAAIAEPLTLALGAGGAWLVSTARNGLFRWTPAGGWQQHAGGDVQIDLLQNGSMLVASAGGMLVEHYDEAWVPAGWARTPVAGRAVVSERTLVATSGRWPELAGALNAAYHDAGLWHVEADEHLAAHPACEPTEDSRCVAHTLASVGATVVASIAGATALDCLMCRPEAGRQPGAPAGLFRSTDGGDTWDHVVTGAGNLCTLVADNGTWWAGAGGWEGNEPHRCISLAGSTSGVLRSMDDGLTWQSVSDGLPSADVIALTASGGAAFAAMRHHGVYRLADASWEAIGAPGAAVNHLAVNADGLVLAATNDGVVGYNGFDWMPVGLGGHHVMHLHVEADGRVLAGTAAGAFRTTAPLVVSQEPPAGLLATSLEAPFPNPAGARATMAFTLAAPGEARLAIYDLLGRRVALLAEEAMEAGRHVVPLALNGIASGVYVVELVAGEERQTRQVTVVR